MLQPPLLCNRRLLRVVVVVVNVVVSLRCSLAASCLAYLLLGVVVAVVVAVVVGLGQALSIGQGLPTCPSQGYPRRRRQLGVLGVLYEPPTPVAAKTLVRWLLRDDSESHRASRFPVAAAAAAADAAPPFA